MRSRGEFVCVAGGRLELEEADGRTRTDLEERGAYSLAHQHTGTKHRKQKAFEVSKAPL